MIQPSTQEQNARGVQARPARLPGLLQAATVTVVSGAACLGWLITTAGTVLPRDDGNAIASSELAQVDEQEIDGALQTMDGSADFLAQFKSRTNECPQPLAWVSLARGPGQGPMTLRLRSGTYISPTFNLSDAPVRVAIPYPGPYNVGHGSLFTIGSGGTAIVALRPPWVASVSRGTATREVTWRVDQRCSQHNG